MLSFQCLFLLCFSTSSDIIKSICKEDYNLKAWKTKKYSIVLSATVLHSIKLLWQAMADFLTVGYTYKNILLNVNIMQIIAFYILSYVSKTIWVLCVCRFCGRSVPPSITSTDNILTLLFVSDSSIVTEGFSASYVSLNATTGTEYIVYGCLFFCLW